jgi:hypothetical protein
MKLQRALSLSLTSSGFGDNNDQKVNLNEFVRSKSTADHDSLSQIEDIPDNSSELS